MTTPAGTKLVIGGNGFIGTHVVDALRHGGHAVRVLDAGAARRDFDWRDVDYRQGTFADPVVLDAALEGVDAVYHLAGTTVPASSNDDPVADVESNLVGTLRLLEGLRRCGVRRIVYFSSGGTVYGNPRALPITEDHPTDPICSYGVVKLAVEKYLSMYQVLHGLAPLVLRPSNPYGPRQGGAGIQGVVAAILDRMLRHEPITLWGDGSVVRDYLYVSDLARLAVTAGASTVTGVFNAGSGEGHSLDDLIATASRVTGASPRVERLPPRDFDVREVVLDVSAAREAFGWRPSTTLEAGIATTWQFMRA